MFGLTHSGIDKMAKLKVSRNAGRIGNLPNLRTLMKKTRRKSPTGAIWFRGLPDASYTLTPAIGREYFFAGQSRKFTLNEEIRLLHQFRRYAYEFYGRSLTEWEGLMVGRHHGLPVRLLDWTSDPLVAAFFACEFASAPKDKPLGDAKLWLLIPSDTLRDRALATVDVFDVAGKPFDVRGIKLVYPMAVAPRINAQSGLFTIQDNPHKALDEYDSDSFDDDDLDVAHLLEYTIPGADRARFLKDLNDLAINHRTLFADLDGLCKGLVTSHILRG